ncbi:MAG: hypothetical protein ABS86_05385 [Sphingobium sp. SCN 64-10]|nr:MAG: hypothetical protein ABS86_05385 [Sphingobium sp. SCN 64-10]
MEPAGRNGNDEATRALVREVGRRSVERLGDGLTRVVGETSALHRWLLTMLVVLNGGALYLCMGGRDAIGPELFARVMLFFFLGLMLAIGAALVAIGFTVPVAASMRKAITHWTDVSVSGELGDQALASAKWVRRIGALWLAVTSLLVFVSLVLFLFGAALLAKRFGVVTAPPPAETVLPVPTPTVAPDEGTGNVMAPAPAPAPGPQTAPLPVVSPTPVTVRPRPSPSPTATARPAASASTPAARPTPKPTTTPTSRPAVAAPTPKPAQPAAPPRETPAPSAPTASVPEPASTTP